MMSRCAMPTVESQGAHFLTPALFLQVMADCHHGNGQINGENGTKMGADVRKT